MYNKKLVGIRIRAFRKNKGLTIKELAKIIGVHWTAVQRWETGKTSVPGKRIHALAKALGVHPSQLFGEEPTIQISYPYVTEIAAGAPILANENVKEVVNILKFFPNDPDLILLKVVGDSMIEEGILEGDWVIIKTNITKLNEKDIYAVAVYHHSQEKVEATLKRIKQVGKHIILIPAHPKHEVQVYHEDEVQIVGKVVRVIRIMK